jgi:hypothetical protein
MFRSLFKEYDGSQKDDRFSAIDEENILEKPLSREQVLENQILALWKDVWRGLYRYHNRRKHSFVHGGDAHLNRLTKLYHVAGMSASHIVESSDGHPDRLDRTHGVLGLLSLALAQEGLRSLRLFDGLAISSLESVIELLEAYKRLLPQMDEIYVTLRSLEVDFRMPTTDDVEAVEEKFRPLADTLARQLLHLDARLALLVLNLGDENWENYGDSQAHKTWLVYDRAFPPERRDKRTKGS